MTKVSAYIRCPIGDASVMARSIWDQLIAVTNISAARGFNLGAIFVDVCNGSTRGCELTRALELARRGTLHALVLAERSRLSRDQADFRILSREFVSQGCDLVFANS